MISLLKYLQNKDSELAPTLIRAMSLVLEGVALHAIAVDDYDRTTFQESIRKNNRDLTNEDINSEQTMLIAGSVIHALEGHGRSTEHQINTRVRELQSIISLLVSTLSRAFHGSHESVSNIQNIDKLLNKTLELDDLRVIKSRLEECLQTVRTEAERTEKNSAGLAEVVHGVVARPHVTDALAFCEPELNPISGLPGKSRCQSALEAALADAGKFFVVPMQIDRLEAVKSRLGDEACHQVVFMVTESLAKKLQKTDQLFHWEGASFVALLERNHPVEVVKREITRITGARIELTVRVGARLVLVPVTFSYLALPLWEHPSVGQMLHQFQTFLDSKKN